MQIQDLESLEWINVDSMRSGVELVQAIEGAGQSAWRPYATATSSGIAIAGAKSKSFVFEQTAYYQSSAAAGAAAGAAATVNGPASVFLSVSISY